MEPRSAVPGGSWLPVDLMVSGELWRLTPNLRFEFPPLSLLKTAVASQLCSRLSLSGKMLPLPLIKSASQQGTRQQRMWRIWVNNWYVDWNLKTGWERLWFTQTAESWMWEDVAGGHIIKIAPHCLSGLVFWLLTCHLCPSCLLSCHLQEKTKWQWHLHFFQV